MDQQRQSTESKNTVRIEAAGPCKKKVSVEIPAESIKNATEKQYSSLGKDAEVPGFRKGRAPRRLLEKRFGKEVSEQIKLKLLADASESVTKEHGLKILGEPDIDFEKIELPENGPLKFDFEVEVHPEFELPALEGIPVKRTKLEVTDEQVVGEIEQLRKWYGTWTPRTGGEVETDDQIIADVVLKVEGVEEEEKLDNTEIHVRQNGFVGGVAVEKLDELLLGAKVGEAKETSVKVPKTYYEQRYRDKKVDLRITIRDIKYLKPAPLDENFLHRFDVDDEEELREKMRDILQRRLEQKSRTEITEQINRYLLDNTEFDLPLDVVADQATNILQRQYIGLMERGFSREQVEEQMEQLRAGSEQQAREQLKRFFIMDKVADTLEISVSEEEINGHIAKLAIQQGQRPERLREQIARNSSLAQVGLTIREEKCLGKLLESVQITEAKPEKKTRKSTTDKTRKSAEKKTGSKKQESAEDKKPSGGR